MQIRLYQDFSRLPLDRNGWNSLARRGSVNTIFQTHQWASAWWTTFGAHHRLLFLAAEKDAEICGFAPLMVTPGQREVHFLADANSDYCDFAASGNRYEFLDAVLRYFARDYTEWRTVVLRNIPEQSPSLATVLSLCAKYRLHPRLSRRIAAPRIDFRQQQAPFKMKYSLRRHSNRLERLGAVGFRVARDRSELPEMLDALYRQHVGRYHEKGEHSLFEQAECRRFYANLADELLDTGWLHFSELSLNGRSLATHFGFEYDNILTWYKPAFDVAYRQYSPGTALIKRLLDYAGERGINALDFTIGNEPFKERFSNAIAYNRTLTLYRTRPAALFHKAKANAITAAKRLLTALRGPNA